MSNQFASNVLLIIYIIMRFLYIYYGNTDKILY